MAETETAEEREQAEAARAAERQRLDELEKKNRDLELNLAREQAGREAERRERERTQDPETNVMTEAQWQELERVNPGKTREEIVADAQRTQAFVAQGLKPLAERTAEAEKRAAAAEARAERLETRRSLEKVEEDFFSQNIALKTHRAEVDKFLATYPDRETVDAKTHAARLELARDYVKGKVRGTMTTRRDEAPESRRLDVDAGEGTGLDEGRPAVDTRGLNEREADAVRRRHAAFGKDASLLDPEGSVKVLDATYTDHGTGAVAGEGVELDTWEEDRKRALSRERRS